MKSCRFPVSYFIARNDERERELVRGRGFCQDPTHRHYILRLWCLDRDVIESRNWEKS